MRSAPIARKPGGEVEVPELVRALASARRLEAVWQNQLGGLTFRDGDRFLKWNPRGSIDLDDERVRLQWAAGRHPVPEVLAFGLDERGQVLVTSALIGDGAVTEAWRARPRDAVRAIAEGLRLLHTLPVDGCPYRCAWANTDDVPAADRVVLHGDPCAPNTIVAPNARFRGHVDVGALGVGDRWADLAVASMSLEWNFGRGSQREFFAAYGIGRDERRIRRYRALWDAAP